MRSIFTGAKKCGGAKRHKGAQPRLAFCVARAAEGGEAVTGLLSDANALTTTLSLFNNNF